MSKFDLSRIVGAAGVSESDTELREIPLDKIRENPENFYPPLPEDEAEALRESIQANGLLEPLLVVADGNTYRLVSGHNRFRALQDLRGNALGMAYKTALCRVLPAMDPDHEITAIIEANRQRKKTPAVLQQEAEALTEVYVRRKQAGEDLPGRIRERVAEVMQVSATKLANLNAIKNGLACDDFKIAWEHGNITESCALEIARMDPWEQERLDDWLSQERLPCTLRTVREFTVIGYLVSRTCDKAGKPCPNARAMYRDRYRDGAWHCAGCCAHCRDKDTCDTCCQYVERRAPEPAEAPEQEHQETPEQQAWPEAEAETATADWQAEREAFGARLGKAREARQPLPEGQLTIAGWMPGSCNPAEPGEFAVLVDVGQAKYFRTFMAWNGDGWEMLPSHQTPELPIGWWLRLPPEPKKGETT